MGNRRTQSPQAVAQTFGFDWATLKEARDAYVYRLNGIYDRLLHSSGVEVINGVGGYVRACVRRSVGRSVDSVIAVWVRASVDQYTGGFSHSVGGACVGSVDGSMDSPQDRDGIRSSLSSIS